MKTLLGINVTDEEFDLLITQQETGKDLKVVNGKVVAVDHIPSKEEIAFQQILLKTERLNELTKDFAQVQAGLVIEDIEERKLEFQTLLNEVRILQGKEPRQIQK